MKKKFKVGEDVIWRFKDDDFDIMNEVKCKITEVNKDYCVARSGGNNNCYDDIRLLIDDFSEDDFFKIK